MKIQIIGFSGSGKTYLAKLLSSYFNIPALHLDGIHFIHNWEERDDISFENLIQQFLRKNDSWIIEGNYLSFATQRFLQCDILIFLNYNRFVCYHNCKKRYQQNKNKARDEMPINCIEKFDKEFKKWILWEGRKSNRKKKFKILVKNHSCSYEFKNRRQLHDFLKQQKILTK